LEGEFEIQKPQGELTLELSKGSNRFQARWNLQTGTCELHRISKDKDETLASMDKFPLKPGKHQLRFSNVDCRLIVWQNGKLIFGDGVDYTPPKFNGPTMANDLEPASIGCKEASVVASDLRLFRDTYYTARINPSTPDVSVNDWTEPPNRKPGQEIPDAWKPLNNPPIKTLFVQPGHYLCLGDNSPQSSDGRSWGLVPDNLMMGRAVVIYFPFHRMGRIQ
jgi:signal peptidase I